MTDILIRIILIVLILLLLLTNYQKKKLADLLTDYIISEKQKGDLTIDPDDSEVETVRKIRKCYPVGLENAIKIKEYLEANRSTD